MLFRSVAEGLCVIRPEVGGSSTGRCTCGRAVSHSFGVAGFAFAYWLACGLLGLVLALGWAFTEHRALWANRNLLLFDPLCLLLLPGAWGVLRGRAPSARFRGLLVAVATIAAFAVVPLWLQTLPQRNGHWIALLLPIHAAFAWAWAKRKA